MTTIKDGTGGFGPDTFNVTDINGNEVAAKYLVDSNGNYVMNPATGKPLVVPADYDPGQTIQQFQAIEQAAFSDIDPDTMSVSERTAVYNSLITDFAAGAPNDLQRSYNGLTNAPDVPAFQAAASYNFGLAAAAGGITNFETNLGGGLYNLWEKWKSSSPIDTSGYLWNNPTNVQFINQGFSAATSGIFSSTPSGNYSVAVCNANGQETELDNYSASGKLLSQDFLNPSTASVLSQNVFIYNSSGTLISQTAINMANENYVFSSTQQVGGGTYNEVSVYSGSTEVYSAALLGVNALYDLSGNINTLTTGNVAAVLEGGAGDTLTSTSAGSTIIENGNNAAISAAANDSIQVNGSGNSIAAAQSDTVTVVGGGNSVSANGSVSGSTFTIEGTGSNADFLNVGGATDLTVLLGDATTMIDLGVNNSLTINSLNGGGTVTGASEDNVNLGGNGITLNASGGQYTLQGSGDSANVSNGSVTLDAGISAVLNGVNSAASSGETVTLDYGANGQDDENIFNFTTGGSQLQYFSGLSSGESEVVDEYSGANGTGTQSWQLTDFTAGTSTQTLYTGLASGQSSETEYFTGTNASGTQSEDLFDFTNGSSQAQYFTGLGSGISELIKEYSATNGTGSETWQITDYSAGGSQEAVLSGLASGDSEVLQNYSGANATGTETSQITDYTAGGSQEVLLSGISASYSSIVEDYSGTNATGSQTEDIYNFSSGGSQAQYFTGLPGGQSEIIDEYSGANATGSVSWQINDYSAGNSAETFYTGLASGETSLSEYFSGSNGSGTNTSDLINLSNGTSQEQLYTGLPSGDSMVLQNYSGSNGTGSLDQQLVDYTNGSEQLDLYSGGLLSAVDNFAASGSLTSQYLYSGGKETQENLFTPGDNYANTQIYVNPNGTENYQDSFNPATGQESQEDIFDGSTSEQERLLFSAGDPYATTELTFYNNGNLSGEINYNTVGQELEDLMFNQGGQETEAALFNPGQQYAYQEDIFSGGNYASQINLFNQSTGAETGWEDFNNLTGQEIGAYSGGASSSLKYIADSNSGGATLWEGGYGYFGGYGLAGSASTVQSAVGSNIGSIAQADLASGNATGASAAQAALNQASEIAASTPTSGTGNAVLEGAQWDSQTVTWSFTPPVGTDSVAEATYLAQVQQAFSTWAAASGLTFEEASSPSQANIQIGFGQLGTATTGVVGYTTGIVLGGQIAGASIELEDPSQDALAAGADGQLAYSGTGATLEQVLLHEIGHALGLADNADQNSVMYYDLTSANRALDGTDLSGIQSLYGNGSGAASSLQVTQLIQTMSSYAPATAVSTNLLVAQQSAQQPLLAATMH